MMEQLSFFEKKHNDPRPPLALNWNLWHGCTRASTGCLNCYVYRRDESIGKDPTVLHKTDNFNLPIRKLRSGQYKGMYKVPCGSHIYTCFSSDFFHPDADGWRKDAWEMMHERSDCTFFMITKRPERTDGRPLIEEVSVGGESGANARVCDYKWVEKVWLQCKENGISFYYHQTGAKLL
ncbi:DUF5131 family protein [Butyrivibrio sp. AD3002]|uniref:DUF5131 family protein n=1 Tax=Butyrivibrio sp. AD3002 TaxID=1280670 RepID=UPI0003B390F1|nr:DUF5131 family protein [Butyrivibrio sp. AD3002]